MKKLTSLFFALAITATAFAQQQEPIKLYPKGVPGSKTAPADYVEKTENQRTSMVTDPTITPYFPEKAKANGAAVIICPGGGYVRLSMYGEGEEVARRFADIGVTAFVLKYRLPSDAIMKDKTIGPLQDAQRAIQLVRQNAVKWNIDPNRVGIMGFSAGGHLASTAITHFNKAVIDNKDNISLRPDFGVLMYPVVTFGDLAHKGSRERLIGTTSDQALVDLYSNEKQVTKETPPTFLVQAQDDRTVPVQNALMFYNELLKNGVKAEMHIYQAGGHGFGLHNKTTTDDWFLHLADWLKLNGFVK